MNEVIAKPLILKAEFIYEANLKLFSVIKYRMVTKEINLSNIEILNTYIFVNVLLNPVKAEATTIIPVISAGTPVRKKNSFRKPIQLLFDIIFIKRFGEQT